METFIEYTNTEEIAIMLMVLEDFEVEHKATSYAVNDTVIARVDITPPEHCENILNLGYDLRGRYQTIHDYLFVERAFTDKTKFLEKNHQEKSKEYKERFSKKVADTEHLFEIECPEFDEEDIDD